MITSAPPRPSSERATPDTKPLDRDEIEALVEALIEEARQETRRRHRRYWAAAAVVAFVSIVVLILLDGGAASQTASPAPSARLAPAAQAGTSRIAFVAGVLKPSPSGGYLRPDLYVMNADGSGLRRLVRDASSPVWSPDGLTLAFEKRFGPKIGQCQACRTEIFVMNADGSGQRNLTGNLGGDIPAWSPNGQFIAFSSTRENSLNPNLYVMNADGSGQRRVTQDAIHVWGSSWSSDGRRLAFTSCVPNTQPGPGNCDIYVVNVDGSSQHQLTRDSETDQNAIWSPDGRVIAFMSYRDERPLGGRKWQELLQVMNADGSGQRKLARLSNSDASFSWSPDGRRIAFVSKRDGNDEVYVISVDGSGLRNLTRNPARDGHPKSSSDGRTIGFVSNRGGNRDIYVMNADGSRQRNLTRGLDQQAFGIAWSPAQ